MQNVKVADSYKPLGICLLGDKKRHIPEACFIKKPFNFNLHLLRLGPRSFALSRSQSVVWIMELGGHFGLWVWLEWRGN